MKYILISNTVLFLMVIIGSCTKKDGDWDDVIKLSAKSAEFTADADSVIITTEGDFWWINNVFANGQSYKYNPDIHPESDNYTIQNDYFTVIKRDKHTLFIRMEENPLSSQRNILVVLEAGDYFDRVSVTQAGRD